ncbi:VWA domain-containing protein, partial [Candidatus Altiarchaeota archaeon]
MMDDKGYAIIVDILFALVVTLLFFSTIVGLKYFGSSPSQESFKRLHYISEDTLDVLNKKGVLDSIGENWAAANGNASSDEFINATNISMEYLEQLIPQTMGYRLWIEGDVVANNSRGIPYDDAMVKTHSTRLLVGYGKGKPTRGYVARAFLTNIREKETSRYAYFGGYIGQGNITIYVNDIPFDATVSRACFELNTPSSFNVHVNDQNIASFTPSGTGMDATVKGSAGCIPGAGLGNFTPGDNKVELMFSTTNISRMYVGGGYLRVTFNTSQMDTAEISKVGYYYFPGINELINLYDSFYVPGELDHLTVHLRYRSNYSLFLNIGDYTVWNSSGNESDQNVTITNAQIQASGIIYNPDLSETSIPIRMGTSNFSTTEIVGKADVILITDMSGSMLRCLNSNTGCSADWQCGGSRCRWPYAKELDKEFIETVLNISGNRVGLVTYSWNAINRHDLSEDEASLNNTIDSLPSPSGGTCVCCAIRMARNMLHAQSTEFRDKYIIVMTDGIANIRCHIGDENRTTCCSQGYCSSPTCGVDLDYDSSCGDYIDDYAIDNTINDTVKTHDDLNATINAIGFGSGAIGCTTATDLLSNISFYGNGSYCASDDAGALQSCYLNFANQIF